MRNRAKITTFFMAAILILTAFTVISVASFGAVGARGSSRAAPTLTGGTVTPSTGNTSTLFEFKVTYTDSDNDSVWIIYVFIDGSPKSLSWVSGTPKTGELYNYKTTLSAGTHTYYFFVNNSQNARFPATGTLSLQVNNTTGSPPTLTNPSVSPQTGDSLTTFTFNVTYTDAEGDQPTNMSLVIDGSWYYKMTYLSGNATFGMKYTYQTTLSTGSHTYFFWVYNAAAESARNPSSGSYILNVTQQTPLPTLWGGAVEPTSGNADTTFTFSVNYKDPGNNWNCHISVQINELIFEMTTTETDLTQGVKYTYSTKLGAGDHNYHFNSKNSELEEVRDPISGVNQLHVDPIPGNAPVLSNPQASPARPNADQTINFTIQYKDIDNDAPKSVELHINKVELSTPFDKYTMNIEGNTYSTGVGCYFNLKLDEGNYTYYFTAESTNTSINNFHQTGYFFILVDPVVSTPTLSGGEVSPKSGTADSTVFKYSVIYQDGSFGSAVVSNVNIDGELYTMTEATGDSGSLGVYYTYSTTLPMGSHTYYYIFSDGKIDIRLPVTGVLDGPEVGAPAGNREPTVSLSISPLTGDLDTTFYFNATATDPDGDEITYSWEFSDGYNAGSQEYVSRKFTEYGEYSVTLTVTDPYGLSATATGVAIVRPGNSPPVIVTNLKAVNEVDKEDVLYISALESYDPDNDPITFSWRLTHAKYTYLETYNVGGFNHRFDLIGRYTLYLEISDGKAKSSETYIINCNGDYQPTKPVAIATVTVNGMIASLSADKSHDPDGYLTSYTWSVYGSEYQGMYCDHTFSSIGYKTATLTVIDNDGLSDKAVVGFFIGRSIPGADPEDSEKIKIDGHFDVDEDEIKVIDSREGFTITIIDSSKNYLKFQVDSETEDSKLVIMDVKTEFDLDKLDQIEIKIDGKAVEKTDLDSVLQASGDRPVYYLIGYGDYYQLFVYIPEGGTSEVVEVELKDDGPGTGTGTVFNLWFILTVLIIAIILIIIIVFLQLKRKEENVYYTDFRVAENRALNGVHSRVGTTKEASDNWDDFI